jgi:hypothetical protein
MFMHLYVIRGFHSNFLKVHKNPYLWATNKTVVQTIMIYSYMNSTKGNCYHSCHDTSEYAEWPMKLIFHKPLVADFNAAKKYSMMASFQLF